MRKTLTFSSKEMKAPDSRGQFTAFIAQTWPEDTPKSNADADGDIFVTGAFDTQTNETIPVYYQHNYAPTSKVGEATLLPQDSRSELPVRGHLFVEQGRPIADGVYESMLLPPDDPMALKEFSVGYEFDNKDVYKRNDGVRVIKSSRVFEVSVVYRGAQQTQLLSVKHQNAPTHIQKAHDSLVMAGAQCGKEAPMEKQAPQPMMDLCQQCMNEMQTQEPDMAAIQDMLQQMMSMAQTGKAEKTAIASHSTATVQSAWDGPAQEAKIPNDAGAAVLRKMFAWVDPNGDPDVKSSYRFIHHMYDGGPGAANTVACSAGIGVLNGGRGGTTIPQGDISGVHAHLARHIMDANMTAPPLKDKDDSDWITDMRRKLLVRAAAV